MKSTIGFPALVLAAATLVPAQTAGAETVNNADELAGHVKVDGYIYSRAMLTELSRQGQAQDERFGLDYRCRNAEDTIKPLNLIVVSPIDLPDGAANPVKGAWMLRYSFTRCGNAKVYNAVFVANQNGGIPTMQSYYPGSPRSGPSLIKNAMPSVLAAAEQRVEDKACRDFAVFDMNVVDMPEDAAGQDAAARGAWKEIWTFRACGKAVDVPITFVPDTKLGGINFVVGGAKTR